VPWTPNAAKSGKICRAEDGGGNAFLAHGENSVESSRAPPGEIRARA
jgi:hypothetical protein